MSHSLLPAVWQFDADQLITHRHSSQLAGCRSSNTGPIIYPHSYSGAFVLEDRVQKVVPTRAVDSNPALQMSSHIGIHKEVVNLVSLRRVGEQNDQYGGSLHL